MKAIKRSLAVLAAFAMTATCIVAGGGAVSASADDGLNLSLGATVTVDSTNTQYAQHVDANINDGDYSSRWQSNTQVSADTPCWATLEYAKVTTINKAVLYFETAGPSVDGTAIRVSDDGVNFTEVTGAVKGEMTDVSTDPAGNTGRTDMKKLEITFDSVSTKYVQVYMTAPREDKYKEMSVWEFETYNVSSAQPVGEFGVKGAQIRKNAEEASYDLRFVTNFSSELYGKIADMTELGVILVRADELEAAGKTTDDINIDLAADGLTVRKVPATYLRDTDLATTGNYTYTVTITGITDTSVEYVCVAYYVTAEGAVYTKALTRCVNDGLVDTPVAG